MEPLLFQGDFVFVSRLFIRLNVGDLVAVAHQEYGIIVKRVFEIDLDNTIQLSGENPESVTTEQMGKIHRSQLLGKVIFSVKK